jgi:hypothetical protein
MHHYNRDVILNDLGLISALMSLLEQYGLKEKINTLRKWFGTNKETIGLFVIENMGLSDLSKLIKMSLEGNYSQALIIQLQNLWMERALNLG